MNDLSCSLNDVETLDTEAVAIQSDKYIFPCLLLKGITSLEELSYFSSLISLNPRLSIPLFIEYNGVKINVSDVDLDFKLFKAMRSISKDYSLSLIKSEEDSVNLDLDDKNTFINAINLGGECAC